MPIDSTAHLMKRLGFALVYALLPAALAQLEVGAGLKVAFGEPRATVEARVGEESFELDEGHPGADRRISLATCQLDFDDNLLWRVTLKRAALLRLPLNAFQENWKNFPEIDGAGLRAWMPRAEFKAYLLRWQARAAQAGKHENADSAAR
jgi:hypothetical protein